MNKLWTDGDLHTPDPDSQLLDVEMTLIYLLFIA